MKPYKRQWNVLALHGQVTPTQGVMAGSSSCTCGNLKYGMARQGPIGIDIDTVTVVSTPQSSSQSVDALLVPHHKKYTKPGSRIASPKVPITLPVSGRSPPAG